MALFTGKNKPSSEKITHSSSNRPPFIGIQAKLLVNQPNDSFEQEADAVADKVVAKDKTTKTPSYVPSTKPIQRVEEETINRKESGEAPTVSPAFQQGLISNRGKGSPLSKDLRTQMESGIGADFGAVRIHTDTQSQSLSGSIQAKAFTHGNDVYFNKGQFNPNSTEGKHLLAHELTHTVQQKAATQLIQRDPGDDEKKVSFVVVIPDGMPSKQAFRRYAELQIFGRVLNLEWTAAAETEVLYNDLSKHYGESVTFTVSQSTLDLYKTDKKDSKTADAEYNGLEGESKDAVSGEIDKRYYESTGVVPGTKIGANDKGSAAVWNDFKQQVMEQKQLLDQLPPEIKEFLHTEGGAKPEDFEKLVKIVELLKQFTTADFLEYKGIVNFETTDLEALRSSIAQYLAGKKQRQKELEQRETIKTKLYGLEELYKRYHTFKVFIEGQAEKLEPDEGGSETEEFKEFKQAFIDREQRIKQQLTDDLIASGFESIDEFGKYIADYEKAFEKETIAIAEDHLLRYRHLLFEEEKKINNDKYITQLFDALTKSGAQAHYDAADSKDSQANRIQRDLGGYAAGDTQLKSSLHQEASSERADGNSAIESLPSELVKEDGFDKEEFAAVGSKEELKTFLQDYLDSKKEAIDETWADIHAHPDHIYELDQLLAASMEAQQIEKDSIFDLIIKDKAARINGFKILKAICFVVIAVALTIVTLGAAAPLAVAAGVGSLGLSLYGVYEAVEDYKRQNAANDVGLLTDDPSLVWVVLAIAGAAIDTAALSAAFKAAKPIAEATTVFNKTGDVVQLEKDLATIADISTQVRSNILKAAMARAQAKEMLKSVLRPSGGMARMVILPGGEEFAKLVATAYYFTKAKVYDFGAFILELKAAKLIDESVGLTADELKILKNAFEKSKSIKDADATILQQIEEAIAQKDFVRFEKLLKAVESSSRNKKIAIEISERVKSKGKFNKSSIYHGDSVHKMPDNVVQDIIANPTAIFETNNGQRLIYLKDGDVVIVEALGSAKGNVITSYGKSGIKGESGAQALGGLPTDQGLPVTEQMILNGTIPSKNGFIEPGRKLYP